MTYLWSIQHAGRVCTASGVCQLGKGGSTVQVSRATEGLREPPSELGALPHKDPLYLAGVGPSPPQPLRGPGPQLQLEGVEAQALL